MRRLDCPYNDLKLNVRPGTLLLAICGLPALQSQLFDTRLGFILAREQRAEELEHDPLRPRT